MNICTLRFLSRIARRRSPDGPIAIRMLTAGRIIAGGFCAVLFGATLTGCALMPGASDNPQQTDQRSSNVEPPTRMFALPAWRNGQRHAMDKLVVRHMPVFLSEADWSAWNRIGTPSLYRDERDQLTVQVDPTTATVYADRRSFTGKSGANYTNLIYRVHFERVPLQFNPLNVSAGRNSGLFVVVTTDAEGNALLYTTVHTCGCYLAIVPTSNLPASSHPDDWAVDEQTIFNERLAGLLVIPDDIATDDLRLTVTFRDSTHRVADLSFDNINRLRKDFLVEPVTLRALNDLHELPVDDGTTASMFAEDGYVRGSAKPLELALISWWALDSRVGQDKRLGKHSDDGQNFYTSLAYGDRQASDMRDFAGFLEFHGWSL